MSTGNINYSLKELIATNTNVRKQWSERQKHLYDALTKLPLLIKENNDLKEKLAIYDETGQINILSNLSRSKQVTNTVESTKSSKQIAPKTALKNNKGKPPPRLPKIEEALTYNNTTKQNSPFTPNSNKNTDVKDFTRNLKETINTWLKKAKVEIEPNEKNRILDELTNDVVARQKYLQTFGETPTQSENLEYLKLQVHRRLNGLVPIGVLKKIIENMKELVTPTDNVEVPQLVVPPESPKTKSKPQKRTTVNFHKPSSSTQRNLGPGDILGILSKATNTTTHDGVSHTIDDDNGVEDESDTEFSPGQASTPSKPSNGDEAKAAEYFDKVTESVTTPSKPSNGDEAKAAEYFDKVTESVTTWLESMPIDMDPELKMDFISDLVTDIVDRQKYLQVNPDNKFSDDEEIENLRFQVFKRLYKVFEPGSSVTPNLAKIEELYKMINGIEVQLNRVVNRGWC